MKKRTYQYGTIAVGHNTENVLFRFQGANREEELTLELPVALARDLASKLCEVANHLSFDENTNWRT